MSEVIPYSVQQLREEIANGQKAVINAHNPVRYVDCADERYLTERCEAQRDDLLPARLFGAASGMAQTAIIATLMQFDDGYKQAKSLLGNYSNGLAGLAAEVSDRAARNLKVLIVQHSADGVEGNELSINQDDETDLGCAYNANNGLVLSYAGHGSTLRILESIGSIIGTSTYPDTKHATDAMLHALPLFGGEDSKVSRKQLAQELQKQRKITPEAIVRGDHCPSNQSTAVLDYAGVKARANGKDYHHSVHVAGDLLPQILSNLGLNAETIRPASTALGVATAQALGIQRYRAITEDTIVRLAA